MDPAQDPSTLLCERCGYVIQGLHVPSNCSECGLPVADSLPSARSGTPWQNRPGLTSWLRTNVSMLRRSVHMFRIVRLEARSGSTLLAANLLLASMIVIAPWSGILLDNPFRNLAWGRSGSMALEVLLTLGRVLFAAAGFLLLTLIEWLGIQFFANRRGRRLTPLAAWQVVAHASIGWVATAITSLIGLIAWLNVSFFGYSGGISRLPGASDWLVLGVPAAGALLGLLIFELLVYTGVRQCRYANRPQPNTERGQPAQA